MAKEVKISLLGSEHTMVETSDLEGALDYPYVIPLWLTYFDDDLGMPARAVLIPSSLLVYQIPRYHSGLERAEMRTAFDGGEMTTILSRINVVLGKRLTRVTLDDLKAQED